MVQAPPPPPPVASAETPAPIAVAALDVDPVLVALGRAEGDGQAPGDVDKARAGMVRLCDEGLARAAQELAAVRALVSKPDAELTFESTLGGLDRVRTALRAAGDFNGLMAVAHPDRETRERAKACEPRVDKFDTELWLDATVAQVIKRYAAKKESLRPAQAYLQERVLRDFRRNGLDLDESKRARVRAINERLSVTTQAFDANIAAAKGMLAANPKQLEGLPAEWLAAHKPQADGTIQVTTDYPDYFPVITYAKDRKFALELYKLFDNRASDKNLVVLDEVLSLRAEKAALLGYKNWADYVIEPRMAKDASTVANFLEGLRTHVKKKGDAELKEFRAQWVKLGGKKGDPFYPSDRLYLEDQVRKAKYGLDSKEVSQYFEVGQVKQGILTLTAAMFGVRYAPLRTATWHPDVEAMQVFDAKTNELLGRFYFDIHPRDDKYKHAAVFSIRDAVTLANGERLVPIAAIECNFPRPAPGAPALMAHHDAVTFFHEFGHVLHHMLSESELSTFSGTAVARDFVESPSQMLEEWAWSKETLDKFAVHHQTKQPLPKKLHDAMLRSRGFGRGLATQRQLFLAALDQAYHTREPGFDTTKVLEEINDAYTPFKYVEGTHFQASFGHLMGYDAGYYGYQWALSIAQDLFTRFKREGMLNETTARDYRHTILALGGSMDARDLVQKFLGRPPNDAAYRAFLLE